MNKFTVSIISICATCFLIGTMSFLFYSIQKKAKEDKMIGYESCVQHVIEAAMIGEVTIPIINENGEQGTIILVPLTEEQDD